MMETIGAKTLENDNAEPQKTGWEEVVEAFEVFYTPEVVPKSLKKPNGLRRYY